MKLLVAALCVLSLAACGSNDATSTGTASSSGNGNGGHVTGGNGAGATGSSGASTAGDSGSSGAATNASSGASTSASNGGGTDDTGASGGNGSATAGNGTATNGSGSTDGTSANGGTTGDCVPDGAFSSDPSMCCSGAVDTGGFCISASAIGTPGSGATSANGGTTANGSTGASATLGTGSTGTSANGGTVGTGSTTGGTCPVNMPNLVTGQGGVGVGACNTNPTAAACPKGYQCIDGQCTLNSSSTLQVTLSFDNIEDFDLHVVEPLPDGGHCEIYYGNAGMPPDAGSLGGLCDLFPEFCGDGGISLPGMQGCGNAWLDRDSNAACGGEDSNGNSQRPDGVNVENVLFVNGAQPPSGTYYVLVDYWENCDSVTCGNGQDSNACSGGYSSSAYGVQVRRPDSSIWQYCGALNRNQADNGGAGSGQLITSFTLP
jgi:hypothetical protein